MRFIDRLIPFLSLESFRESGLTAYWILVSIAIFSFALWLLYKGRKNIKENINLLSSSTKLRKIWEAYQNTFYDYGEEKKTEEPADSYFNESNIIYTLTNYRLISTASSTLVGFGILGTFVGLTFGISGTNFETTETIKVSINDLLSGMGTAFVTSIWAMGLSIIYTICLKNWQSNLSKRIDNLCFELDEKYKLKQHEIENYRQASQKKVINELFTEYLVAETESGKQLPKNVFRQLLAESEKQTSALQSFSDDLGESISLAMEKLVHDNNDQISLLIEERLVPVLEDLKMIKQDSGTQVIENAVEGLASSMKSMMEDFKSTITNDTREEMEALMKRVAIVSEALLGVPGSMREITQQVSEVVNALKNTVSESIRQSEIQSQEMNKQNQETFSTATREYKSTFENIQGYMESLMAAQKNNITQVSELTKEIKAVLAGNRQVNQQFDSMISKSAVVVELIEGVSSKLKLNSEGLSKTSDNFKHSIQQYGTSISEFVVRNENLLNNQKVMLEKTRDIASEYGDSFVTIKEGLSGIFGQIQEGLKDYKKTTADVLNEYLTSFSTTLTKAHEGLENTVSGLTEINEELSEQLERFVSVR